MAIDRISVRLDPKTIKFLEQVGGDGRGAISRGVGAVIEFAQTMPESFALWMTGANLDWDTIDKVTAFGIAREVSQCDADA